MLALLSAASLFALASANSRGSGVPCNVNVAVGSDDVNTKSDRPMWWASKATWAGTKYTLRSGDSTSPSADATTYTAERWMEIYIRSNAQHQQFTGLVLYAENAKGKKVGQWTIPPKAPFHQPGDCVVHTNANKKRYLEKFRVRFPAGTGRVSIKAMVKYGLANPVKDGGFFWPNSEHLVLDEQQPAQATISWHEGEAGGGQSCTSVCKQLQGSCSLASLKADGTAPLSLLDAASSSTTCFPPLMASCSSASPAVSPDGCFFHDATCEPPKPEPVPTKTCDRYCSDTSQPPVYPVTPGQCCKFGANRFPPEMQNVCMCLVSGTDPAGSYSEYNGVWERGAQPGDTSAPTPEPPVKETLDCESTITWNTKANRLCACSGVPYNMQGGSDASTLSPATKPSPTYTGLAWAVVALVLVGSQASAGDKAMVGARRGNRAAFSCLSLFPPLLLGLVLLPAQAQAHNWMTSPSRGNEAGENNGFNGHQAPPCPQKSARIHAQVGPGQKFPIEWAAGHGFGSFTYFAVLKASDEKMMQEHSIEVFEDYLAAAPSVDYLSEDPVFHVSHKVNSNGLLDNNDVADSYLWVPSMPATVGQRPPGFRDFGPSPVVMGKTEAGRAADRRAQYKNEQYPWLISVHRFTMQYDFPEDADTTMMEIPVDAGPGSYVIQYWWSGYYDCIDVNVLDDPSTDIFGSGGGSTGYDRIDHCEYISTYDNFGVVTECRAVDPADGAQSCQQLCENEASCEAVQVAKTALSPQVLKAGVWSGTSHLSSACAGVEGDYVCYGVSIGTPQVGPSYLISADPEDPVFYNSCFKKSAGWQFQQTCSSCAPTLIEPGWVFGDECITCDDMRSNARPGTNIPVWAFTSQPEECRHCDGG